MSERLTNYRVFIGGWNDDGEPDWSLLDKSGLSWPDAREIMLAHFRLYAGDKCDHCQVDGRREMERLMAAPAGYFEGEIDGNDCLIIPETA